MSYDEYQSQGMSRSTKILLGCGAVLFIGFVLLCGGVLFVANKGLDLAQHLAGEVFERIDEFAGRFEQRGYQRVTGQVVDVRSDVRQPTVYTVQVLTLHANTEHSIAILAQAAEIRGTINGDLHFLGQMLTLHPEAVVKGNVYLEMVQHFEHKGKVEGEVVQGRAPDVPEAPADRPAEQPADRPAEPVPPADEPRAPDSAPAQPADPGSAPQQPAPGTAEPQSVPNDPTAVKPPPGDVVPRQTPDDLPPGEPTTNRSPET
jgi:hypothetical protein